MRESSLARHYGRDRLAKSLAPSCALAVALTLLPIAMLLVNNRGAISTVGPIYRVGFGAAIIALAGTAAVSRALAPHVAAAIVGALGYGFFSMSWVGDGAGTTIITFLWIAISGLASAVLVWLLSDSKLVLNIAAVTTSALCVVMIGAFALAGSGSGPVSNAIPTALAFSEDPPSRPNVYVLVLDAFGRPEVLADQFAQAGIDFDIAPSLSALEGLGFVEDTKATTNYAETVLSVASTLNGTFHHTPDDPLESSEVWDTGRAALQGDNALAASLRDIGYEYWHSSSGIWDVSACNANLADRCLGESISNIESTSAVWSMTPLHRLIGHPDPEDLSEPTMVANNVLAARAERTNTNPYFLFAHIISPHQPYRFDRACNPIDPAENGSSLNVGHVPHFRQFFADQAMCLGTQLEDAMSQIITADPTAIIVLQGDHGSAFTIDFDDLDWSDGELTERFAVFRMLRMPERCQPAEPDAHSLVNTSALIIGCIANEPPVLAPARVYLTSYDADFSVVEVQLPSEATS